MDFYYGRLSGNSARCAFALAETGASYDGHLIDTRALRQMKPTAILINTSRGEILDERASRDAYVRAESTRTRALRGTKRSSDRPDAHA